MPTVQERMFKFPNERKGIFIVGFALTTAFSLLIGFLNVGALFLFGLPFLGLVSGIVLIWFSRISAAAKIAISLLPLPLIVGSFFLFLWIRTAEAEAFIIPATYRGEIVVFYDEPCGNPAKFEQGMRLYEISPEGILVTKAPENDGYLNRRFYFVREDGTHQEIPQFGRQDFETEKAEWSKFTRATKPDLTLDTVGAFWAYGRETYHISRNSIGYIISDYRLWERDAKSRFDERKKFTERAAELLEQCRRSG